MKRDNLEVLGGLLMLFLLPYIAIIERVFRVHDVDWRGRPRYIVSGFLSTLAWAIFIVHAVVLVLILNA
jgi:hypothetical protein